MSPDIPGNPIDLNSRIMEADACYSMGLLEEALAIYMLILEKRDGLDPQRDRNIRGRIEDIRSRLHSLDDEPPTPLSTREMTMIQATLSGEENASSALSGAAALRELGLFQEAAGEYEKAFRLLIPDKKLLLEYVECLLKLLPPEGASGRILKNVEKLPLEAPRKAQLLFAVGLELEKRNLQELAAGFFQAAKGLYPEEEELQKRSEAPTANGTSGSRYGYLLANGIITREQLQKSLLHSKKTGSSVEAVLMDQLKIKKEEIGKSLSEYYGVPFRGFDEQASIPVELSRNLKKAFLKNEKWVPLNWGKKGVEILIDDPKDLRKTDHIRALMKTGKILFQVGTREDIDRTIESFFGRREEGLEEEAASEMDWIPEFTFEEDEEGEDIQDGMDESSSQVVRLVDQVMITAFRKNASDIHIEPSPMTKKVSFRLRVDGVCQEYLQVPISMGHGILSRIKIMANLDIAEKRLPQDGKIKFKRKGVPHFEMRLATLPTAGGYEDAVLRLLAKAGAMKLNEIGLNDRNLRIMTKIISLPYGLILVVGPTGSGKTTTLHSALGYINKPGIKIWTAEDPVEITQLGLRQVEVKHKIGLDFARVMRSFLRADPDVIMIGEMRDFETASIGVEASLTGHLVFSTLHTNSAPETVTRLLDMGLNALNFSDAFLGVLAQRLVRRLCIKCRKAYHPTREEFDEIVREYGAEAFEATSQIRFAPDMTLYYPAGCEECSGTGYRGRMGIHELMEGTPQVKRLIKKQAPTEELFTVAAQEGMTTLKQDGIMKVFQCLTDMSEVRRVCLT